MALINELPFPLRLSALGMQIDWLINDYTYTALVVCTPDSLSVQFVLNITVLCLQRMQSKSETFTWINSHGAPLGPVEQRINDMLQTLDI